MKITILLFAHIIIGVGCFAQPLAISGKIFDRNTEDALAYVNIGVLGKPIGTVTNKYGEFELIFNGISPHDSIRFSLIGYKSIKLAKRDINGEEELILKLEKDTIQIPEVLITSKVFTRERHVGKKSQSNRIITGWSGYGKGGERGTKINIRRNPSLIKEISVHIASHGYDSTLLRMRIYSIKDNQPYKNLLYDNIFLKITLLND